LVSWQSFKLIEPLDGFVLCGLVWSCDYCWERGMLSQFVWIFGRWVFVERLFFVTNGCQLFSDFSSVYGFEFFGSNRSVVTYIEIRWFDCWESYQLWECQPCTWASVWFICHHCIGGEFCIQCIYTTQSLS